MVVPPQITEEELRLATDARDSFLRRQARVADRRAKLQRSLA